MKIKDHAIIRNRVKCLDCGKVLESKHRHQFVRCGCPNDCSTDGGLDYVHWGARNLNRVEVLTEYKPVLRDMYEWEVCQVCGNGPEKGGAHKFDCQEGHE